MSKKPVVLVVEDNDLVREAYIDILSVVAEVHAVANYTDAISKICALENNIKAVTLDMNFPLHKGEMKDINMTMSHGASLAVIIKKANPETRVFSASSDDWGNMILERLGCERSDKRTAAEAVVKFLGGV